MISLTAARQDCTETGALVQICWASASASARAWPGSVRTLTKPDLVGACRVNRTPGEDQLPGDIEGQGPRRPEEAGAGRHHPDADLRQAEARRARGDDQIAGEDDLESSAEGRALDRGDQRLAAPAADDPVLPAALRVL